MSMAHGLPFSCSMKTKCPSCPLEHQSPSVFRTLRRAGRFWRKSDGRWISRFCCLTCKKTFSRATLSENYRQKKRHKNEPVRRLLAGGVSLRETARILNLNRKTVARKMLVLAQQAEKELQASNASHVQALEVEFDELETFEHTKCKPLSVPLMVEYKTRRILGFEVASMPAKGKLARISRKKYGYRKDERPQKRRHLLEKMTAFVSRSFDPFGFSSCVSGRDKIKVPACDPSPNPWRTRCDNRARGTQEIKVGSDF